jgi:hypothetical protein
MSDKTMEITTYTENGVVWVKMTQETLAQLLGETVLALYLKVPDAK